MVYLSRIYTKTGDDGRTALGNGDRVDKDHARVAAYGTVDELNSELGVLLACCPDYEERELALSLQNELFDLGADLCVPGAAGDKLRVSAGQVERLEQSIDRINADLPPLRSFVLPGGTMAAAYLHRARCVCRRAERDVVTLCSVKAEDVNPHAISYLNRLSDLLFVMARAACPGTEVLWQPGQSR